jgi:hypothetical protein
MVTHDSCWQYERQEGGRGDGERQHQAPVRPALAAGRGGMGGRHEGPEPSTDLFMAVVVFALIALLAIVIILALGNP